MADRLKYELVSPERLERHGEAHMVVVPGTEGELGIMAGHAPLMTSLKVGEVAIYATENSQPERIRITGGFAEVSETGLTILAEKLETPAADSSGQG